MTTRQLRSRIQQAARGRLLWAILAALAAIGMVWTNAVSAQTPAPGTYRVKDGKVDEATFSGWVLYHTACFICHGRDAIGTHVAPPLLNALSTMSRQEFANKVLTRYRLTTGSMESSTDEQGDVKQLILDEVRKSERGSLGMVSMPGWRGNPGVEAHLLDLYAYLKARADGALGPGQPAVTPP